MPERAFSFCIKISRNIDPACKTGVFLREIAKRLMTGLSLRIPDEEERRRHIFTKQLFGIAITEMTSLLSRRSLYCSKFANTFYSIAPFETIDGNIRFKNTNHHWDGNKCGFCGASKAQYDRDERLEQHAYEFIHTIKPEEIFDMRFDVIIGNPPYQLSDGGHGVSAQPIYHHFVEQAKKLNPRYLSMIIPSRWYAGGKGLDDFRATMLNDSRMKIIVDYETSKECFQGVDIAGGICYFLWEAAYEGDCTIKNMSGNTEYTATRRLNEFPVLIRSNMGVNIVKKVLSFKEKTMDKQVLPRNPFNFQTNFRGKAASFKDSVPILTSEGIQHVADSEVVKNRDVIHTHKVLIGRLVPSNGELNLKPGDKYRVITNTTRLKPGEITTESYIIIGHFKTGQEADNFEAYIKLKLPRFLLKQSVSSVNVTRETFRFVPIQDYTKEWTDALLYEKYGLTDEEVDFVENIMKPME